MAERLENSEVKKMVILKWSITQKFAFGIPTVLAITNLCVLVVCPEQSLAENRTSLFKFLTVSVATVNVDKYKVD